MFGLIKTIFIKWLYACLYVRFGESLISNLKRPVKCVSLSNQPCKARPTIVNIKSDKTLLIKFYSYTVTVNESGGSCNTSDDPYSQVCDQNKVRNMNLKVFILMSGVNKTIFIIQQESCECKCVFNERACSSKLKWNRDEYRCEFKELDDLGSCEKD